MLLTIHYFKIIILKLNMKNIIIFMTLNIILYNNIITLYYSILTM